MPTVRRSVCAAGLTAGAATAEGTGFAGVPAGSGLTPDAASPPDSTGPAEDSPCEIGVVLYYGADDRQAEGNQPEKRRGDLSMALEGFVVLAMHHGGLRRRQGVVRELRDELLNRRIGVEPDLDGVGPHEGPAENAAGQARELIPLERLEGAN